MLAKYIEYTRVALGCTLLPVWLAHTGVYLIKFLIVNLSYSPCSEPDGVQGRFEPPVSVIMLSPGVTGA